MENKPQYIKPHEIEGRSMEIIEAELSDMGKTIDEKNASVIKRVIHTTADFDYADNLYFSENVVDTLREKIRAGILIVTDTRMAYSGINKTRLKEYECECLCLMDDEQVALRAQEEGVTRAVISVDKVMELERDFIYVVGNAPTALMRLHEFMGKTDRIKGIIGVPVGFVNVVEAKEQIIEDKVPCIIARGRKGGSNVAAAIVNALVYGI